MSRMQIVNNFGPWFDKQIHLIRVLNFILGTLFYYFEYITLVNNLEI